MTKLQYMEQLKQKLKRLPREDFQKAIDYFEEYFAEAGEGNEAQAIEDLGSPQTAAEQIIREFAIENSSSGESKKDVKKGFNGVWIVILAIFASPIALPMVFAVIAVLFAILVTVISVLAAIGISGVAFAITGPVALIGGLMMLARSVPVALVSIGLGLVFIAAGIMIVYASYLLLRKFLNWVVVEFGKKFAKGEKKNENK